MHRVVKPLPVKVRTFSPPQRDSELISGLPIAPSPEALATTNLPPASTNLPVMDISYQWNHTTCGLLGSFTYHDVFKIHPCCRTFQYFTSFYCWILLHLWIDHILPVYSSVWPFGFHFLATVSNIAMNRYISFCVHRCFSFLLGIYMPESRIAGLYGNPV